MTITIHTGDKILTFDNDSPMAEEGKIGYGQITDGCCLDGELTKAEAKKCINEWVKEFLK